MLERQFQACRALACAATKFDRDCYLVWFPGDCPSVRPSGVAPADAHEYCHDGDDAYDLWYTGNRAPRAIIQSGLSLEQAVALFRKIDIHHLMGSDNGTA
jgi:hypothetical protein